MDKHMGCMGINEVTNLSDVFEVVMARLTYLFNMMFHTQFRIKIKNKISNNLTSVLFSFSLSLFMVIQDLILLRHILTFSKGASYLISRGKILYLCIISII